MYVTSNYRGRQTPATTHYPPTYNFHVKPGTLYTLIMLGYSPPDQTGSALSPPSLHMIYINITDPGTIKPSNIITPYRAPSPPFSTGRRHYITILYEQRHPIYGQSTIGDWGRRHFNVDSFVAKYGLKTVASTEFFVDATA